MPRTKRRKLEAMTACAPSTKTNSSEYSTMAFDDRALQAKQSEENARRVAPMAYSIEECALAYGLGRTTMFNLFSQGRGPRTFRVGRRVLISAEAAQEWIRSLERDSGVAA